MKKIFEKVSRAKSVRDLDLLIDENAEIKAKVEKFEKKYPRLGSKITQKGVAKALSDKKITEDHLINLEKGRFSELEKLLIAVLWKNGHITRMQSVLDGIVGKKTSVSMYGVVFNQFGKSLSSQGEPIIDQHVLRAFCAYGDLSSVNGRKNIPKRATMNVSDQQLIDAYTAWAKSITSFVKEGEASEFAYKFDKVLFAMGQILGKQS